MNATVQRQSLLPSMAEWQIIKDQASILVKSGFLPSSIKTPEQAITIAVKGLELGIPMMQAFSHIAIIQGRPTMSAELMLAQIFKHVPGAKISYLQYDAEACEIEASRPGSSMKIRFSMEDAKRAGLLGKDNWNKWPRAMLRSRCISEVARSLFPDALAGVSHTPEELAPDRPMEAIDVEVIAPKQTLVEKPVEKTVMAQPAANVSENELNKLMTYVVPFGKKLKGQLLVNCSLDEALGCRDWLREDAAKNGKALSGQAKEFCEMVAIYEAQLLKEETNSIPSSSLESSSHAQ